MNRSVHLLVCVVLVACTANPTISPGPGVRGSGTGGATGTGAAGRAPDFGFGAPPASGAAGGLPAGGGGLKCGQQTFNLVKAPADLLIVLDRSGSMRDTVPGTMGSKWLNVTGAITDALTATDATLSWGLKTFPNPEGCTVPPAPDVPIAAHNAVPISAAMAAISPNGATPTALAINNAVTYLKTSATGTLKYLVLATDGLPNCRGEMDGGGDDVMGAVAAVADAAAAGFHTFVIGVAVTGTMGDNTLTELAIAGGEPRPTDPKYYSVSNRADLVTTLGLITGQITNCVFPLGTLPPAPDDVTVKVDGTVVARDAAHMNGWDFTAGSRGVQVYGPACENLKMNKMARVEVVYGCYIP